MDDRRLSTVRWEDPKGKDSTLMAFLAGRARQLGVSAGKGGHCFFNTLLDQRIELLDPKKYGQERIEGRQTKRNETCAKRPDY